MIRVCLLFVAVGGCDGGGSQAARCRAVHGMHVTVRIGARVSTEGITGGSRADCDDDAVASIVVSLHDVLVSVPAASRPTLTVHLDARLGAGQGPVRRVETHRAAGELLVARDAATDIDPTTWLHEIAHAKIRRREASEPLTERLLAAAEEGVADYYGAAYARTPRLGVVDGAAERDLTRPPPLSTLDWASLAGAGPGWDPHRAGWALGAALWDEAGPDRDLADDLVSSLKAAPSPSTDTANEVVEAWVGACPERSRARLNTVVRRWLPQPMLREAP